jgi:predicted dehydrogenase
MTLVETEKSSIFNTLIVGLGKIGFSYDLDLKPTKYILTHSRAVVRNPNCKLVAGIDPDQKVRQLFENQVKAPAYESIREVPKLDRLDILIVATPTVSHLLTLQEALSIFKPQVVLLEKPIAANLKDSIQVQEISISTGIPFYVNYPRRSDSAAILVGEKILSGEFLAPFTGTVRYSGGILNGASHFINLLQFWLHGSISINALNISRINEYDFSGIFELCIGDSKVLFYPTAPMLPLEASLVLFGKNGRLEWDTQADFILWSPLETSKIFHETYRYSDASIKMKNSFSSYQAAVLNQLIDSINGIPSHICTLVDALETSKAVDKLFRSIDE